MKLNGWKFKNTLDRINKWLDTAEGKISVLEDTAIETILNENWRYKRHLKSFKTAPVSCEAT